MDEFVVGPDPRSAVGRGRRAASRVRRPLAAILAGGSVAGFAAVHVVHAAAVVAGPIAAQFVCSVPH